MYGKNLRGIIFEGEIIIYLDNGDGNLYKLCKFIGRILMKF